MSLYLGTTPIADSGNGKANTDLSNLTSQGQNIANWSTNVTNCLTEIPQDIKLELNNGTLILKAGSKVYVPNGAGVFDAVTISSDIRNATTGAGEKMFLSVYNNGTNLFAGYTTGGTVSERPVSPINYALYYNTTTNKVEFYNGSTWISNCSFPIVIYTRGAIGATSIDQVFNGFGYIGSTVFALPGVKGLIPNGRNADGSLKNVELQFTQVTTVTNEYQYSGYIAITSNYFDLKQGDLYNETDNRNYLSDGVTPFNRCIAGKFVKGTNGIVTSLTLKTAFHALDYNDSSTISGWAMPSSRYIDLTLGASGTTYTAPANGYFCLRASPAATGTYTLLNSANGIIAESKTGATPSIFIPSKKGDSIKAYYTTSVEYLRFVYAEGEN